MCQCNYSSNFNGGKQTMDITINFKVAQDDYKSYERELENFLNNLDDVVFDVDVEEVED